jgi:hypothetical protein
MQLGVTLERTKRPVPEVAATGKDFIYGVAWP